MTDGRISAREPYAFETASGQTIYLHPVRRILLGKIEKRMEAEWEARGKVVTLPTRRFQTFGGDWDEEQLDPKTADETIASIEDKAERERLAALWAKYQRDRREFAEAVLSRQMDVMLARGVEFDMPEDESWIAEQEAIGVEVPTVAHERRVHYLTTELLYEHEVGIVAGILQTLTLGHVVEKEDIEAFMSFFRRSAGRSNGDAVRKLAEFVEHLEALVLASPAVGDEGGEGVGIAA